jgi:hypothetical protein
MLFCLSRLDMLVGTNKLNNGGTPTKKVSFVTNGGEDEDDDDDYDDEYDDRDMDANNVQDINGGESSRESNERAERLERVR